MVPRVRINHTRAHKILKCGRIRCVQGDALILTLGTIPEKASPYVLLVRMGIPPEHEAEFNDWYNTEHVPALTSVPGVYGARRYRATAGSPTTWRCMNWLMLTYVRATPGGKPPIPLDPAHAPALSRPRRNLRPAHQSHAVVG